MGDRAPSALRSVATPWQHSSPLRIQPVISKIVGFELETKDSCTELGDSNRNTGSVLFLRRELPVLHRKNDAQGPGHKDWWTAKCNLPTPCYSMHCFLYTKCFCECNVSVMPTDWQSILHTMKLMWCPPCDLNLFCCHLLKASKGTIHTLYAFITHNQYAIGRQLSPCNRS